LISIANAGKLPISLQLRGLARDEETGGIGEKPKPSHKVVEDI
jgi:hypothetical protein